MPEPTNTSVVDLVAALRERLAIIGDESSRLDEERHVARLRAVSAKIDSLQAALPKPVDPRLDHYLQRKSYDKALEFLQDIVGQSPLRGLITRPPRDRGD